MGLGPERPILPGPVDNHAHSGRSRGIWRLGSATLKNYMNLIWQWFGRDLRKYQVLLMPISFIKDIYPSAGIVLNKEESNLLYSAF
jgi:hypothetical protein